MKNLTLSVIAMFLFFQFAPTQLKAESSAGLITTMNAKPVDPSSGSVLTARLEEIKSMDKSAMSSSEKRHLRREVRSIKKEINGGVYLSTGAIILIVVLLIILL